MRDNMSSLDTYIATVNSEIGKFNKYANINYEALNARGEKYNDMMLNLFKGYIDDADKE